MNWSVEFAPLVATGVIAALGVAGALLVAAGLWARARGGLLRALALGALVLALLNPTIREEDREALSDVAVLVVDRSHSQELGNRGARTDAAEQHLRAEFNELADTEVRVVEVRSGITSSQDGTRAFEALKSALSDVPPERYAGAILLTDGQVHDVPSSLDEIGYDGPLHGVLTGERQENDRRIVVEAAPRFAIVGQKQTIRFRVEGNGAAAGGQVLVSLSVDGGEPRDILVDVGQSVEADIVIGHGGQNLTELSVPVLPGELSVQNNRAVIVTKGIRDRLRVLLISGEPHPGERTWRNLLKADASVDLVHFTILRPPEKQDGTPIRELSLIAFPTRELFVEKLQEFDLIIFDRYQRRGVLPMAYLANIAGYIEQGGAVLVAAGPDYATGLSLYRTPLSGVLPLVPSGLVVEQPYRAQITDEGKRHPVTRGLPGAETETGEPDWGRWFRLIDGEAREGNIVMSGPGNKPLMVLARREEGRIAQLMSDHAWLWARGYEGGGPQAELLRRLAHWLMKEPELEEEALAGRQDGGRVVIERRTMAESAQPVDVTLPGGDSKRVDLKSVEPGIWQGSITVSEAGIHRLSDGVLTSFVAVGSADPRESAEIHATEDKLRPMVEASGGGFAWLARSGSDRLSLPRLAKVKPGRAMQGSGWLGLKANGAYRVKAVEQIPLFGTLLALAGLLSLICLMWYREGR
jgi:hypothetical protein